MTSKTRAGGGQASGPYRPRIPGASAQNRTPSPQPQGPAPAAAGAGATDFNGTEASRFLNSRFKAVEAGVNDTNVPLSDRPEVHRGKPWGGSGGGGSAWGAHKGVMNAGTFVSELWKAVDAQAKTSSGAVKSS